MPIGGGQGAAADIDGNFTLSVPSSVKKAKITYVGYHEQTVDLHDGMVVKLVSDAKMLDEAIVVAYGTANKESLTGSVAVVGAKDIEDRPVTSVTAALEGNAPGVQVNNSTGTPGSAPSIRIRGFNSINGSNSPLYVVDGIVFEGSIADLNPADIESMSVLKDAASCALYGNRGANGVILITTKRAKTSGNVEVSLQIRQGIYERGLPFYDTLDADTWMEQTLYGWAHGRYSTGTYPTMEAAMAASAPSMVNGLLRGVNIYDMAANEIFSPEGKLVAKRLPGYTDLDWWDVVSQTGYRQEYNINATGATEKFNVFASVGYLKENGYMLKTDFERFNGRMVANFEPVKYFRMGANIAASYTDSDTGAADSEQLNAVSNPFLVNTFAPINPYYAHDEEGNILVGDDGKPVWNTEGLNKGNNVAWNMRLDDNNYNTLDVNASAYATAVIPYGFELTVRGNISRRKTNSRSYANNKIGSQQNVGGLDVSADDFRTHTFMQTLTWDHQYGDHHIDVLLDHENYELFENMWFLRKSEQLLPDLITVSNFQNNDLSYDGEVKYRTESYLGRVRYNYDQKYFGEVSIRRDGTSRFAKDNKWGTFWSVGGSWVLSKEKFLRDVSWIDFLKLRAAYGSVGNDASAGAYAYMSLFGMATYDNVNVLLPTQLAAPHIKWEATKTFDIALEGNLFNDRFNFSIGYFNKRNSDLLFNVTQMASSGGTSNNGVLASIMQNIGTMQNIGWELAFGVDIIRNSSFTWDFNIDATFMKNKIIKLPDGKDLVGQSLFQGKSIYEMYTYEWAGVDKTTGNSLYSMEPNSPDYYTYDENNVLQYDQAYYDSQVLAAKQSGHYFEIDGKGYTDRTQYAGRKIMGTSLPTVYGSFSTNLSWKGFNLGLLFTYSLGGKTYNSVYAGLMSPSSDNPSALHKNVLNSWTSAPAGSTPHEVITEVNPNNDKIKYLTYVLKPGDIDPDGVPVFDNQLSSYNNASSSQYLVSSNYLSLKNINLTYDFPKKWVNRLSLSNINLGVSIDNLFLITRQKGMNPQYGFAGGQGNYYVPARVISFQLGVKF